MKKQDIFWLQLNWTAPYLSTNISASLHYIPPENREKINWRTSLSVCISEVYKSVNIHTKMSNTEQNVPLTEIWHQIKQIWLCNLQACFKYLVPCTVLLRCLPAERGLLGLQGLQRWAWLHCQGWCRLSWTQWSRQSWQVLCRFEDRGVTMRGTSQATFTNRSIISCELLNYSYLSSNYKLFSFQNRILTNSYWVVSIPHFL